MQLKKISHKVTENTKFFLCELSVFVGSFDRLRISPKNYLKKSISLYLGSNQKASSTNSSSLSTL